MTPLQLQPGTLNFAALTIGFFFGFVLERAGFGNARNLAAQFYLYDMRVLKVMFTAIVTAMVLIFLGSSLGLIDFARLWVPPTYLWSGVFGGLVLGVGFIIGGYCPGTSLVSMSTLKLDGLFFVFGVWFGMLVFAPTITAPALWGFWNHAGAMGHLTLFDLLGVDAGLVVLAVVLMAVGAFWFAEQVERRLATGGAGQEPSPRARFLRRAAVAIGLMAAVLMSLVGQPTVERKIAWAEPALSERLESRQLHIDPAELLGLMHNNQVRLVLFDVRDEADFNAFHLLDARRVTFKELETGLPARLPPEAVVVVMSNDEQAANEAWKRLAVRPNVNAYVLAGGLNRWLDVYHDRANVPGPETPPRGSDAMRHPFSLALGARHPVSRPDLKTAPQRPFTAKVKVLGPVRSEGGGCG